MRSTRVKAAIAVAAIGVAGTTTAAVAGGGKKAKLTGFQEVPAVLTDGTGKLKLKIDKSTQTIDYVLNWEGLEGGSATQAHIHIGQRLANGGIAVWFCGNPQVGPPPINPPAGTQACPAGPSGMVSGTITPANILAVPAQSLTAGDFEEFVRAIRRGLTYANIHNAMSPGGEIRGQIGRNGGDDDDGDTDSDD